MFLGGPRASGFFLILARVSQPCNFGENKRTSLSLKRVADVFVTSFHAFEARIANTISSFK